MSISFHPNVKPVVQYYQIQIKAFAMDPLIFLIPTNQTIIVVMKIIKTIQLPFAQV